MQIEDKTFKLQKTTYHSGRNFAHDKTSAQASKPRQFETMSQSLTEVK